MADDEVRLLSLVEGHPEIRASGLCQLTPAANTSLGAAFERKTSVPMCLLGNRLMNSCVSVIIGNSKRSLSCQWVSQTQSELASLCSTS